MIDTKMKWRIVWLVMIGWLAASILTKPADAYKPYTKSPIDRLFTNQVIPANGSVTSDAIEVGFSEIQGFDWHVVPASGNPSINVVFLQCNLSTDTYSLWAPLDGSTVTNDVTITTARGGSGVLLSPSLLMKVRLNNTASQSANVTLRSLCQ